MMMNENGQSRCSQRTQASPRRPDRRVEVAAPASRLDAPYRVLQDGEHERAGAATGTSAAARPLTVARNRIEVVDHRSLLSWKSPDVPSLTSVLRHPVAQGHPPGTPSAAQRGDVRDSPRRDVLDPADPLVAAARASAARCSTKAGRVVARAGRGHGPPPAVIRMPSASVPRAEVRPGRRHRYGTAVRLR
jgi:hypothetical protein